MTSQLTPQELEQQLACLYCGIIWSGTWKQQQASAKRGLHEGPPFVTTVDDQLNAMAPDEARAARRKFRKLWRSHAKRKGLPIASITKGMMGSKAIWAEREALHIYRERNNTVTPGGEQ